MKTDRLYAYRESRIRVRMYIFWKQFYAWVMKENTTLFSTDTLLLPSSEGIIAEVKDNPNAIGYDGLGYITPEVKVLAVARSLTSEYILPSADTVNTDAYPIARDLYMYTASTP